MGCAASSQPAEGNGVQTPTAGRSSTVAGGETRISDDRPHGGGEAAQSNTRSNGDGAAGGGGNTAKDGQSAAASQAAQAIATFTTHVMIDSRGAKVSTVIQNKGKVETLCKWADNVLKARSAGGGVFPNPQDGRVRKSQGASAPQQDQQTTSSAGDTASVSSRHNAGATSRTEYGSIASNAGLLGVSTTAQGAASSVSRGNLTVAAQRGSDDEEPQLSPMRPETEISPLPPLM